MEWRRERGRESLEFVDVGERREVRGGRRVGWRTDWGRERRRDFVRWRN